VSSAVISGSVTVSASPVTIPVVVAFALLPWANMDKINNSIKNKSFVQAAAIFLKLKDY